MLKADELKNNQTFIDKRWVCARPLLGGPFWWRVKDAWAVLTGKADAVSFYKQ